MNTITCPDCGQQANAFGSVTSCWSDKMYCDHLNGMFAEYRCGCGSCGETPEAKRHREHQLSKFEADMERDVSKLLQPLGPTIQNTFKPQSVQASASDVQVVFANGQSAVITVTGVYSTPEEFQVASGGQTRTIKGRQELKAALAAIAEA